MTNVPFLLSINLKSAMLLKNRLMLDSILSAAIYIDTQDEYKALHDVPLQKTGLVYHGSQLFVSDHTVSSDVGIIEKCSLDSDLFSPNGRGGKSYSSVPPGSYKAKIDFQEITQSHRAYFFGCGDIGRVSELMELLPGIGAKTNMGWGAIDSFEIIKIPRDVSLIHGDLPARPIPVALWGELFGIKVDESTRSYESSHAPYWLSTNKEWCVCVDENRLSLDSLRGLCR